MKEFCKILFCVIVFCSITMTKIDGYTPFQAFLIRLIAFVIEFGLLYGGGFFS